MRTLLVLLAALLLVPLAPAAEPPDDVDEVALAALLVRDGHWDRARAVLDDVDLDEPGLDLGRYYTLSGLVHLNAEAPLAAAADLEQAIALGNTDPWLRVVLAQAWLAAGRTEDAARALNEGGDATMAIPEAWLLRVRIDRARGDVAAAWADLDEGAQRFPERPEWEEQQVALLVELGLSQEARARGQAMLVRRGEDPRAWALFAESLRRGGELDAAIAVLEEARLRFPTDTQLPRQLAQAWLSAGHPLAAGQILQAAAESEPALLVEAAECYRRAGQLTRAMALNERVPDPAARTRQRLGLLLEQESFDRAVALAPRLERLGLLAEDEVAYGLGYAFFRVGDLPAAERALRAVDDPAVFRRATALRQAMATCAEEGLCG